jgi:hypothetical protein
MKNKFLLIAGFAIIAVSAALPVFAGYSDPPIGVSPSNCPPSVEGCNTPLNVSATRQSKAGSLIVGGKLSVGTTTGTTYLPNLTANGLVYALGTNAAGLGADFCIASKDGVAVKCLSTAGGSSVTGGLPAGTSGQTLRHNGTGWIANSNLFNNGTAVRIGPSFTLPDELLSVYGGNMNLETAIDLGTVSNRRWKIAANPYDAAKNYYSLTIAQKDAAGDLILTDGTRAGNVGIGKTAPAYKLDVNGAVQMTGLRMPTGAVNGYVLTADSSGNATWQPKSSSGGGTILSGTPGRLTMFNSNGTGLANSPLYVWYTNPTTGAQYVKTDTRLDVGGGLYVGGQITISGGMPGNGKILVSDANGLASWKLPSEVIVIPPPPPVQTGKIWYTGEHCGLYVSGTTASGKVAANGKVNCVVNGNIYDPSIECPTGFLQLGGDFSNSNDNVSPDRFMYTCVKK